MSHSYAVMNRAKLNLKCRLLSTQKRVHMPTKHQLCMYVAPPNSQKIQVSPHISTSERSVLVSSKFLQFQVKSEQQNSLLLWGDSLPLHCWYLNSRPLETEQKCLYVALELTGALHWYYKQIKPLSQGIDDPYLNLMYHYKYCKILSCPCLILCEYVHISLCSSNIQNELQFSFFPFSFWFQENQANICIFIDTITSTTWFLFL